MSFTMMSGSKVKSCIDQGENISEIQNKDQNSYGTFQDSFILSKELDELYRSVPW